MTVSASSAAGATAPVDEQAMFRKITWHLMPILFIAYGVHYIDRINIGYAKLQMLQTLPWSETIYGLGAGIFFIGYLAFEIPSNLLLEKTGARLTLLRIMFCWGVTAASMMFVKTPMQFYIVRFLQGAFEAGFFPGVLLFLTYWYPNARRGRMIALFMVAIPISGILAGPMSGALLKFMDGVNGWHGWQWLFLVQGLPAAVLGIAAYLMLTDRPEQASWLTQDEKNHLRKQLDADAGQAKDEGAHGLASVLQVLKTPLVWALALTYFLTLGGNYAVGFMMPTLIKSWGVQDLFMVGVYSAIPYIAGAIGMLALGFSSDRMEERRWHYVFAMMCSVAGMILILLTQGHFAAQLAALSLGIFGLLPNASLLFALVTERLPKAQAAAGIAAISCLGNLGPSVMPSIVGAVVEATGNPLSTLHIVVAVFVAACAVLLWSVPAAQRSRGVLAAA
ncbi:MAG: MFS transporter [Burkholderiaceae bacterium]